MSAIAGRVRGGAGPTSEDAVYRLLSSSRGRGRDLFAIQAVGPACVGVSRYAWECVPGLSGTTMLARWGSLLVAADASLYYLQDLAAAIGRTEVPLPAPSAGPGEWILAAYRAWGDGCLARLEGDFAFLLWDGARRRLLAARDFGGTRPLFYAATGRTLALASTLDGLRDVSGVSDDLDLVALAEDAAGLNTAFPEATCYRGIRRLPAGSALVWRADEPVRVFRFWEPPVFEQGQGVSETEAAEALATMIGRAVRERCPPGERTTVWLSGGFDSSAVLAAGRRELGDGAERLQAVSMSYPPGDRGREDETIALIAGHCGIRPTWVTSERIPPLDAPFERALCRDEPFAHVFEMWNRALIDGTRRAGARIALSGNGGDQLFQVSPVFLADQMAQGRWWSVWREWRSSGLAGSGFRSFFGWALQPVLPPVAERMITGLRRGRPVRPYLVDAIPPWIDAGFVRRYQLDQRVRWRPPRRPGEGRASVETAWYFLGAFGPKIIGAVSTLGLEGGVEIRSPLYDGRIVKFAATRPRTDRRAGRETKRLLRRAMQDYLPVEVLAARPRRTGLPGDYLTQCLAAVLPTMVQSISRRSLLAELGIIDPARYVASWRAYERAGEAAGPWRANLYDTAAAEYWLRSRLRCDTSTAGDLAA